MQALLDAIAAMPPLTDASRIFHGRGGLYPGREAWTLDWYPPVLVLTSFGPARGQQVAAAGALASAHIDSQGEPENCVNRPSPASSQTSLPRPSARP